jgi:D-glycero-D-manno-heptose 1,7-bisphosphate phosphatase
MISCFLGEDIVIDAVYYCPFHPIHGKGKYKKDSLDRKPNPGMLFRAKNDLEIDLSLSILIGDRETDIAAAKSALIGTSIIMVVNEEGISSEADYKVRSLSQVSRLLFQAT